MRSQQYTHQAATATTDGPATSSARRQACTATTSAITSTAPFGRTSAAPSATRPAARSWRVLDQHERPHRRGEEDRRRVGHREHERRREQRQRPHRQLRHRGPPCRRGEAVHARERHEEQHLVDDEDRRLVVGHLAERPDEPREQREERPLRERRRRPVRSRCGRCRGRRRRPTRVATCTKRDPRAGSFTAASSTTIDTTRDSSHGATTPAPREQPRHALRGPSCGPGRQVAFSHRHRATVGESARPEGAPAPTGTLLRGPGGATR